MIDDLRNFFRDLGCPQEGVEVKNLDEKSINDASYNI